MTAIAAQTSEKNAVPRGKTAGCNGRRATDKYWGLLFIVVLIIWMVAARHVLIELLYPADASNVKFDSQVSEVKGSHNSNEKFDSTRNKKVHLSGYVDFERALTRCWGSSGYGRRQFGRLLIITERSSDQAMGSTNQIWGQNWILDMVVCNVGFFNENYQKSGSIVIWGNVLFCVCMIAYSLASLSTNKAYRIVFPVFGFYFFLTAFVRFVFYLNDANVTIRYWLVPELIFGSIAVLWVFIYLDATEDNVKKEKKISNQSILSEIGDALQVFAHVLLTILPFALYLKALAVFATFVFHSKLEKTFLYSLVGIVCYASLIIHYFALMVISCAISLAQERGRWYPGILDYLRALLILARYHIGTACCHATIIAPKIKGILIMNEEEFKVIPIFSTINRIYMMNSKVHDLSLMMTCARGYDYSESARESLRLSTRDSPKPIKNCYPSISQFFRCGSILLMAINNLVIIGLWAYGVMLESNSVVANCYLYLTTMFVTSVLGRVVDVWSDTDWLYISENANKKTVQTV